MLKTALASLFLSLAVFVLGETGVAGAPLEIGRIGVMIALTLSTVVVGGQLIFGRHPDAL